MGNPAATTLANQTNDAKLATKNNSSSANINYNQVMDDFHADTSRIHKKTSASTFKALDFSDAAIYGKGDNEGIVTTEDEKFRHFHQMRIFIQKGRTIKHGADSYEQTMIVCNLPEQIQYTLNSKWGNPIKFGDEGLFNLLMQVGSKQLNINAPSGTLRASTLKIWQNTDPLTLNLQIPVIDDGASVSGTNLVEALEILGSLVLPRKDEDKWFYTPPPSPLDINITYSSLNPYKDKEDTPRSINLATRNEARIMIQLGGVLLIDNCIIESLTVQYPNTKAQILHDYSEIPGDKPDFGTTGHKYLHPLLAVINLKVSTLEALTANTYSNMLWAKPQSGEGHYDGNLSHITDGIRKATQWLLDIDTDEQGRVLDSQGNVISEMKKKNKKVTE